MTPDKNNRSVIRTNVLGAKAFTLIELLVVISIIAVLIAILMPALGAARGSAEMISEAAAQKQALIGYQVYATDNKDVLLEGYPNKASGRDRDGTVYADSSSPIIRRYPWRLAPALDGELAGVLYVNDTLATWDGSASTAYGISVGPAFGLNTRYVGGNGGMGFLPYIKRADQSADPSGLIVFGTSRRATGSPGSHSPGYFEIYPPMVDAFELDTQASGLFGNLFPRWNGKANMGLLDGHVETMDQETLGDSRYWSDKARRANDPDWTF